MAMFDPDVKHNGNYINSIRFDGKAIHHVKRDGHTIWTRDQEFIDEFTYSTTSSPRLDLASNYVWRNVDNGSIYMRLGGSNDYGPYASSISKDGRYQTRSYFTTPFAGYNILVEIKFQEDVKNDRNVGLSLGGIGGEGNPEMYFLYASSDGTYITRGSGAPQSERTAILYSNEGMDRYNAGDTISLVRTWVNSTTDQLTAYYNHTSLTTFQTTNLKTMPENSIGIDKSVNYVGIRSAFHRAYFTNYFAPAIDRFRAYTF